VEECIRRPRSGIIANLPLVTEANKGNLLARIDFLSERGYDPGPSDYEATVPELISWVSVQ
jgi:hypothetical protein